MLSTLQALLRKPVESLGFEWVDVVMCAPKPGESGRLCVAIDYPGGVTLDHCAQVTRHLSALLDVADPIPFPYILEVSSPGPNRPLRDPLAYQRVLKRAIQIDLKQPIQGKKKWRGELMFATDTDVGLATSVGQLTVSLCNIHSAHLISDESVLKGIHE